MRRGLLLALLLVGATIGDAAVVQVRHPEGTLRGFLVIRRLSGERVGHGELVQNPEGDEIVNHLVLRFDDGSVHDERATYSQRGVFRLEAYRLTQRGPSFPGTEVTFDRKSGQYHATVRERIGGDEKVASGALEMPDDLYNGMALTVLKNLPRGQSVTGHLAAFTPTPRLLTMEFSRTGEDRVAFAGDPKAAVIYQVKLEIGGLTGVVASLIGKNPPDFRYWLASGDIPAFIRFEGAMFLNGPVWRVEMAGVD